MIDPEDGASADNERELLRRLPLEHDPSGQSPLACFRGKALQDFVAADIAEPTRRIEYIGDVDLKSVEGHDANRVEGQRALYLFSPMPAGKRVGMELLLQHPVDDVRSNPR